MREAGENTVDWLIALKDGRIRLYSGRTGVGVGQKGQSETFFEIDLSPVDGDHAALPANARWDSDSEFAGACVPAAM